MLVNELGEFEGLAAFLGMGLVSAIQRRDDETAHGVEIPFAFVALYGRQCVILGQREFVVAGYDHDGLVHFERVLVISVDGEGLGRAHPVTGVRGMVCRYGLAVP